MESSEPTASPAALERPRLQEVLPLPPCAWHHSWGRSLDACTKMQRGVQRGNCRSAHAGTHAPIAHSAETHQIPGVHTPAAPCPHRTSAQQTPGSTPPRACRAAFARAGGAGNWAHAPSPAPNMLIRSRITLAFLDKGFNEILGLTRTRAAACEWQLSGTQKVTCPRTGLAALF